MQGYTSILPSPSILPALPQNSSRVIANITSGSVTFAQVRRPSSSRQAVCPMAGLSPSYITV